MNIPNMINGEFVTSEKYKEILILDKLLTDANMPHETVKLYDGFQVCYPNRDTQISDAIEHWGSYGSDLDLIEIMGLTENGDSVEGSLTAKEVFDRFKMHYSSMRGGES